MGHAIAKNTFYQKLKLLAGFINRIAYSGIRAISNTQYDIQKCQTMHALIFVI